MNPVVPVVRLVDWGVLFQQFQLCSEFVSQSLSIDVGEIVSVAGFSDLVICR
jgi:hypothetical protein